MHLTSKIQIGVLRLQCTSRRPRISPDNQEAKVYFPTVPVVESQSLTVWSYDADATSLPSGEKATDKTSCEWPSSVCRVPLQFACLFEILHIRLGISCGGGARGGS